MCTERQQKHNPQQAARQRMETQHSSGAHGAANAVQDRVKPGPLLNHKAAEKARQRDGSTASTASKKFLADHKILLTVTL